MQAQKEYPLGKLFKSHSGSELLHFSGPPCTMTTAHMINMTCTHTHTHNGLNRCMYITLDTVRTIFTSLGQEHHVLVWTNMCVYGNSKGNARFLQDTIYQLLFTIYRCWNGQSRCHDNPSRTLNLLRYNVMWHIYARTSMLPNTFHVRIDHTVSLRTRTKSSVISGATVIADRMLWQNK